MNERRREIKDFNAEAGTTSRDLRRDGGHVDREARIPDAPLGTNDTPKRVVQIPISRPSEALVLFTAIAMDSILGPASGTLPTVLGGPIDSFITT